MPPIVPHPDAQAALGALSQDRRPPRSVAAFLLLTIEGERATGGARLLCLGVATPGPPALHRNRTNLDRDATNPSRPTSRMAVG